jgi:SAM-dependent methyltransferase
MDHSASPILRAFLALTQASFRPDLTMSDPVNVATFAVDSNAYAAARPTYPPAVFDWIAAQAPARNAAWDVGCGTGQATAALAERFIHVIGSDLAAEQIAQAPRLPNVDWVVGAAEAVTPAPASLDLVLVAQALHWFDLDRFYPQVQQALAPRGVFATISYSWFTIDPALDAAVKTTLLDPIAPYWAPGNVLLWNGYRDIVFPFDAVATPPFVIELDWTLAQLLAYVASWSAVKRIKAEAGIDVIAQAAPRLGSLWSDGTGDRIRRVSMPMGVRVGRKQG